MGNNLKLDLVNVNVHTKFAQIMLHLIHSQYIERKIYEILTSIKGRNSIKKKAKNNG